LLASVCPPSRWIGGIARSHGCDQQVVVRDSGKRHVNGLDRCLLRGDEHGASMQALVHILK
jgi:hypothetical protein